MPVLRSYLHRTRFGNALAAATRVSLRPRSRRLSQLQRGGSGRSTHSLTADRAAGFQVAAPLQHRSLLLPVVEVGREPI